MSSHQQRGMSLSKISRPSGHRPALRSLAAAALLATLASISGGQAQQQPGSEPGAPAQPDPDAERSPPAQQPPATGEAAPAEPPLELQRFQDWAVRCGRPEGQTQEVCEMLQERSDKGGRPMMGVAVAQVANSPNPGMLIVLPLGIALPEGVALQIDGGEELPVPVQRCQRRGCEVEVLLEPDLLAQLKTGQQATVLFHVEQPRGVQRLAVPISLLGFTAALDEVLS
jgi:invasion protein IalB